jgi:hypothetical protein
VVGTRWRRQRPVEEKLLRQDLFDEFCEEFTREMNRLGREHRASLWPATREIGQLDTARKKLIEMAMEGVAGIGGEGRAERNAARREQLEAQLVATEERPPLLHPEMARIYRTKVTELAEARPEPRAALRLRRLCAGSPLAARSRLS